MTEKEQILYNAIEKGMDEPKCGWLHEFADEGKTTSGLVSSLVKKGLIESDCVEEIGCPDAYWVNIKE